MSLLHTKLGYVVIGQRKYVITWNVVKATHNQCNVHTGAINIKTQMNIGGPSQGLILVCGRI